jgi:hypothetical protein
MPRTRTPVVLLLAALLGVAIAGGCSSRAGGSDPADAARLLRDVLDAWKAGSTLDAATQQTGSVISDPDWKAGKRLIAYEVGVETKPVGFDLGYTVSLELRDATGKAERKDARFTVATRPARTVIRSPFDEL